jgi:hypothetical protein
MARNPFDKALFLAATAACLAAGGADAAGMGSASRPSGGQGGALAPAASPYAILAPVTLENTPGGKGMAPFQGRPSLCQPGEREVATSTGLRCAPGR